MPARLLALALLAGGCGASTPPSSPEPSPEPTPSAQPAVAATIELEYLTGPFESACAALPSDEPFDCGSIWSFEQGGPPPEDSIALRSRHEVSEGPFLEVHFAEYEFEPQLGDSTCELLLRTREGWFGVPLDQLCSNSGSVRVFVEAELGFEAIGPAREPRLVVTVEERSSHIMEGEGWLWDTVVCGVSGASVSCARWRTGRRVVPNEEDYGEPVDWRAPLSFEPPDLLVVGPHSRPDDVDRLVPPPGRYRLAF